MNSCLLWVGGKKKLATRIVSHFPEHRLYCEPFCGAAWVFFRKQKSEIEVINDLNGSLITFWKVIQDKEKMLEFRKRLEQIPISEQLFYNFKDKIVFKDDIEQAVCFYYCLKLSFSASEVDATFGDTVEMESKFLSFRNTDWESIWKRLQRVTILNRDAVEVIEQYDSPHTLFYCDPPYMVSDDRQDYKFQDSFLHQRLLNILRNLKGKFILSYDCNPSIKQMYDWAHITKLQLKYGLGNSDNMDTRRYREEYLITNFEIGKTTQLGKWYK